MDLCTVLRHPFPKEVAEKILASLEGATMVPSKTGVPYIPPPPPNNQWFVRFADDQPWVEVEASCADAALEAHHKKYGKKPYGPGWDVTQTPY